MFLLRIKNINDLSKLKSNKSELLFLKEEFFSKLYLLKKFKKVKLLSLLRNQKKSSENVISYIIGISLTNTNVNIYVTDIKGNVKLLASAGNLGLNGKQKTKKPAVIIKLLRLVLTKMAFLNTGYIALHLKNFTEFYVSFIVSLIKKHLNIELLRVFNNKPHNGCRPKKLKRKKRKKLSF